MRKKNRRFRFSLGKLLLFLTFCGVLCGWFCHAKIYPAYRRKAAITHFRSLNVEFLYGAPSRRAFPQFLEHYPEKVPRLDGPRWVRKLIGQEWLESPPTAIRCLEANRPLDEADFRRLLELPTIEQIDLNCNQVPRGPSFVSLAKHREQTITDLGFQSLAKLPYLSRLIVVYAKLTDQGLASLAESRTLEMLAIEHSDVSDRGLLHLARLPSLRELSVKGTHVTAKGIAEFVVLRPDVRVLADSDDINLVTNDTSPSRIRWRKEAQAVDFDPDEWYVAESRVVNGSRMISLKKFTPTAVERSLNEPSSATISSPIPKSSSPKLDSTQLLAPSSLVESVRRRLHGAQNNGSRIVEESSATQ